MSHAIYKIHWTYIDSKRHIRDQVTHGCTMCLDHAAAMRYVQVCRRHNTHSSSSWYTIHSVALDDVDAETWFEVSHSPEERVVSLVRVHK